MSYISYNHPKKSIGYLYMDSIYLKIFNMGFTVIVASEWYSVLETELGFLHMTGKFSTPELHSQL